MRYDNALNAQSHKILQILEPFVKNIVNSQLSKSTYIEQYIVPKLLR